ncbi:MAG: DUF4271 domain-containing protein [Flammeovirgaceae bacterium]|nr:DUF4271 domain-containing protein [Flammeovirgaceae bacterium]
MVVFYYAEPVAPNFLTNESSTLANHFKNWGVLSAIIFSLILIKLVLVYVFSGLFKIMEVLPLQFFNFVRINFLAFCSISVGCLIIFFMDQDIWILHVHLLWFLVAFYVIWLLLIFLKLMPDNRFRLFHLFSYLCGSEIIPIIILIKTLY